MFARNRIIGALVSFVIIYGLLIFPWPGWNDLYGAWFRILGRAAFSREGTPRIVLFEPHQVRHGFSTLDTNVTLANRALIDSAGDGPITTIDLDTRSIGWLPTALTLALILATPVPWRQRGWALVGGLLLIHAYILFTLQVWIWDESPGLSLLQLPSYMKPILDDLQDALIIQLGPSFSIPILIWLLVTFRREDLVRLASPSDKNKKHGTK